jgi:hypothetical protein
MATGMNAKRFETKSRDEPDEVRTPDKTRVEVVRLEGFTISNPAGAGRSASSRSSALKAAKLGMSVTSYLAASRSG